MASPALEPDIDRASAQLIRDMLDQELQHRQRLRANAGRAHMITAEEHEIVQQLRAVDRQLNKLERTAKKNPNTTIQTYLAEREREQRDRAGKGHRASSSDADFSHQLEAQGDDRVETDESSTSFDMNDYLDYDAMIVDQGEPASAVPLRPVVNSVSEVASFGPPRECIACCEDVARDKSYEAPCSHVYCMECLKKFLEEGILSEANFPPSCCKQPVPFDSVRRLLPADFMSKLDSKTKEYAIEPKLRIYCLTCSSFLAGAAALSEKNYSTCHPCGVSVCHRCRKERHRGPCPTEQESTEFTSLANKSGWRNCPKCSSMVEKTDGCNHIKCLCGNHFCYTCGGPWKGYDQACCNPYTPIAGQPFPYGWDHQQLELHQMEMQRNMLAAYRHRRRNATADVPNVDEAEGLRLDQGRMRRVPFEYRQNPLRAYRIDYDDGFGDPTDFLFPAQGFLGQVVGQTPTPIPLAQNAGPLPGAGLGPYGRAGTADDTRRQTTPRPGNEGNTHNPDSSPSEISPKTTEERTRTRTQLGTRNTVNRRKVTTTTGPTSPNRGQPRASNESTRINVPANEDPLYRRHFDAFRYGNGQDGTSAEPYPRPPAPAPGQVTPPGFRTPDFGVPPVVVERGRRLLQRWDPLIRNWTFAPPAVSPTADSTRSASGFLPRTPMPPLGAAPIGMPPFATVAERSTASRPDPRPAHLRGAGRPTVPSSHTIGHDVHYSPPPPAAEIIPYFGGYAFAPDPVDENYGPDPGLFPGQGRRLGGANNGQEVIDLTQPDPTLPPNGGPSAAAPLGNLFAPMIGRPLAGTREDPWSV